MVARKILIRDELYAKYRGARSCSRDRSVIEVQASLQDALTRRSLPGAGSDGLFSDAPPGQRIWREILAARSHFSAFGILSKGRSSQSENLLPASCGKMRCPGAWGLLKMLL